LSEHQFTLGEAERLSTVPGPVLHHWSRHGFLTPSIHRGRGTGNRKLYSLADVAAAAVMDAFRQCGTVRLESLKPAADLVQKTDVENLPTGTCLALTLSGEAFLCVGRDFTEQIQPLNGEKLTWLCFGIRKEHAAPIERWGGGMWGFINLSALMDELQDNIAELRAEQEQARTAKAA
jgi:DNA-binding transcriptional MerR regulator